MGRLNDACDWWKAFVLWASVPLVSKEQRKMAVQQAHVVWQVWMLIGRSVIRCRPSNLHVVARERFVLTRDKRERRRETTARALFLLNGATDKLHSKTHKTHTLPYTTYCCCCFYVLISFCCAGRRSPRRHGVRGGERAKTTHSVETLATHMVTFSHVRKVENRIKNRRCTLFTKMVHSNP